MSNLKTVISLTTIPPRIDFIKPVLESLLKQGLPVYLWLPKNVARLDSGFNEVPEWITDLGVNVKLVKDFGPITKLLPALELADIVITADDDHIYTEGWARDLLGWSEKLTDAALGNRGRILTKGAGYNKSRVIHQPKKPVLVDIITGVYGALYRSKFFKKSIFEEYKRWPDNDDLVIGAHLIRQGTPLIVVPHSCKIKITRASSIEPLSDENTGKAKRNNEGLRLLYGLKI